MCSPVRLCSFNPNELTLGKPLTELNEKNYVEAFQKNTLSNIFSIFRLTRNKLIYMNTFTQNEVHHNLPCESKLMIAAENQTEQNPFCYYVAEDNSVYCVEIHGDYLNEAQFKQIFVHNCEITSIYAAHNGIYVGDSCGNVTLYGGEQRKMYSNSNFLMNLLPISSAKASILAISVDNLIAFYDSNNYLNIYLNDKICKKFKIENPNDEIPQISAVLDKVSLSFRNGEIYIFKAEGESIIEEGQNTLNSIIMSCPINTTHYIHEIDYFSTNDPTVSLPITHIYNKDSQLEVEWGPELEFSTMFDTLNCFPSERISVFVDCIQNLRSIFLNDQHIIRILNFVFAKFLQIEIEYLPNYIPAISLDSESLVNIFEKVIQQIKSCEIVEFFEDLFFAFQQETLLNNSPQNIYCIYNKDYIEVYYTSKTAIFSTIVPLIEDSSILFEPLSLFRGFAKLKLTRSAEVDFDICYSRYYFEDFMREQEKIQRSIDLILKLKNTTSFGDSIANLLGTKNLDQNNLSLFFSGKLLKDPHYFDDFIARIRSHVTVLYKNKGYSGLLVRIAQDVQKSLPRFIYRHYENKTIQNGKFVEPSIKEAVQYFCEHDPIKAKQIGSLCYSVFASGTSYDQASKSSNSAIKKLIDDFENSFGYLNEPTRYTEMPSMKQYTIKTLTQININLLYTNQYMFYLTFALLLAQKYFNDKLTMAASEFLDIALTKCQYFSSLYSLIHCTVASSANLFSIFSNILTTDNIFNKLYYDTKFLKSLIDHNMTDVVIHFVDSIKYPTPEQLLMHSLATLYIDSGTPKILFISSFKRFLALSDNVPGDFIDEVQKRVSDFEFIQFIELCPMMIETRFSQFFRACLRVKKYDSAFIALCRDIKKAEFLFGVDVLATTMAKAGQSRRFLEFPFGTRLADFGRAMQYGSPSSVLLSATFYRQIGEYSKAAASLYNYIECVLAKINVSVEELKQAKSAAVILISLMKNHEIYIRNSSSKYLVHFRDVEGMYRLINVLLLQSDEIEPLNLTKMDRSIINTTNVTSNELASYFNNPYFDISNKDIHKKIVLKLIKDPPIKTEKKPKDNTDINELLLSTLYSIHSKINQNAFLTAVLGAYLEKKQSPPIWIVFEINKRQPTLLPEFQKDDAKQSEKIELLYKELTDYLIDSQTK